MHIFLMRTHNKEILWSHSCIRKRKVSGSMSTVRRVAKNMLVWFFGDIVGKILSLAFVMLRSIFMRKAMAYSLLLSLSQASVSSRT